MNLPQAAWTQELQQQTREAIEEMRVAPDGCLHFKHKALGFGTIKAEDLLEGELLIQPIKGGEALRYQDTENLLSAGWAID